MECKPEGYQIVFNVDGKIYGRGMICGMWYEPRDGGCSEPCGEPILEIREVEPILDYLQEQGYSWDVIDGKVKIFETKEEYDEFLRNARKAIVD